MKHVLMLIIAILTIVTLVAIVHIPSYAQQGGGAGIPMRGMHDPWSDILLPLEFDNRPFDTRMTRLPPFYGGYDPVLLYNRVQGMRGDSIVAGPVPGRQERERSGGLPIPFPRIDTVDLNKAYAVRIVPDDRYYEASKRLLQIYCRLSPVKTEGTQDKSRKSLIVKYQPWVDNKYSSTGGRGEKVEIEEHKFHEYGVALSNVDGFTVETIVLPNVKRFFEKKSKKSGDGDSIEDHPAQETIIGRVIVNQKEASRLKESAMALALFRIVTPYASSDTIYVKQTSPVYREYFGHHHYLHVRLKELWFYEPETGKILLKIKEKQSS